MILIITYEVPKYKKKIIESKKTGSFGNYNLNTKNIILKKKFENV